MLGQLPELADWQIAAQPNMAVAGRNYRPDFTLTRGPLRVLVEIDGADKGPNAPSHDEWTRRQTALASDGWEILRFTNRQVMHEQEYCRRHVASTVARLHERARLSADPLLSRGPAASPGAAQPVTPSGPARSGIGGRASPQTWAAAGVAGLALAAAVNYWIVHSQDAPSMPRSGSATPIDDGRMVGFVVCPPTHPLRGNVNQRGERIYHRPEDPFYDRTKPESCFATDAAARADGYRPAG